jgi:dipeptidyl-peptidase 4
MLRAAVFCFTLLSALPVAAARKPVTVEAVLAHPASRPPQITWSPDGERFIVNDHGVLSVYDIHSGKDHRVIAVEELDRAAVPAPPSAVYDWTDRHVSEHDVQWFADGKRVLVAASGDLFIVDLNKGHFEALTQTPEVERDPKLSPDNRYVSFLRGSDLFSLEVAEKSVTRLTTNGSATLLNGQLDWVYPEELDLGTAHWWSPDSQSIAYLQFDVSREPVFPQVSLLNSRGVLEPERYPKAGDPNAEVRLGIVSPAGGETKWMNLGEPRGFLLSRVVWSPSSHELIAERLNRVQNKLDLLLVDTATGSSKSVLHEEDPYWINIQGEPIFLGRGDRFLWTSERSGFRHLYVYTAQGSLQLQLTKGDWEVDNVAGVDETHQRVFFTSTEDGPTQRQVYSVSLDGTNKQKLSKDRGVHAISLAPNAETYMDDSSSLSRPVRRALHRSDGSEIREYKQADATATDEFDIRPTEIVTVKASDGTTLYARLIKPAGFEAGKKYPAVVVVYGGPGVQAVQDSWPGMNSEQVLASRGFVIWQLDNRGSAGRGHRFESVIWHNMGERELSDQKEGIQYLVSQGFVDPKRIGLYGWSYGGYMSLYTVTHAPGLIKAAVSGDPVTSWRNYDSIYTERYMGLPEDDEEGYRKSSPQTSAADMQGTRLLMVHNIEDDNVHFQNSVQMAAALEKADKRFFMVVYPQKTHHVAGPEYKQLLDEVIGFFEENLK